MSKDLSLLGKEVDIPRIESELCALWEAGTGTTRASLINFAVYSEATDALLRNTPIIAEITREHASRALLIAAGIDRPAAPPRAWITAHCNLSGTHKAVCSEQISFQLDGKGTGRIRNIVFAHLDSDLPLALWWQGELSRVFEPRFYAIVDRLIFDSADWKDPGPGFGRVHAAVAERGSRITVHDLCWTRSHFLRTAIASLFDDTGMTSQLGSLHCVKITHGTGHRIAALWLVAWLGRSLAWTLNKPDSGGFTFESSGGPVEIEILEDAESPPLGAVVMHSAQSELEVAHEKGTRFLKGRTMFHGGEFKGQLFPADPSGCAPLVSSQLERSGNNTLMLKSLPLFLDLL